MTDSHDPAQAFSYERRGLSRDRHGRVLGAVVYRYLTAEDRANHLLAERRVLEKR